MSLTSPVGDKFKLLKFDDRVGGLELSLQEVALKFDSRRALSADFTLRARRVSTTSL